MTQQAANPFPVTIAHKYGITTIEKRPERIVTVGLTEQDVLLALGITPVGTTEWFGEYPGAIWPWAEDKLTGATPEVVGDATVVNYENIAALKPDLILALYSGLTQDEYDLLTQIAPTVAQPGEYVEYGVPWQELTEKVGLAVGKAEEAKALVADVEARFEKVKAEHPEFKGATAVVATPYEGIWVYGAEDARGRFLSALGFELPTGINEVTGADFGGNLSLERVDMLDVDVIIWLDADEAKGPLGGPLYSSLAVHTEGREVFVDSYDDPLGGATSFVSVLSLPFLLDGLTPMLTAAVDGDPDTLVPPSKTLETAAPFPITIEHKYGSTTLERKPERIITVGLTDHDAFLALGIAPVGTTDWYGGYPYSVWPWAQDELGDAKPANVGDGATINYEAIAALKPDVIVALYAGLTQEQYDLLTQIAPTVAQPADEVDYGITWQNLTLTAGKIVGESEKAKTLVGDVEAQFEKIKTEHPEFVGASAVIATPYEGIWVYNPNVGNNRLLAQLGFKLPDALGELTGDQGGTNLSLEKVEMLDVDALVWLDAKPDEGPLAEAVYKNLKVHKEGREVFLDCTAELACASFISVLSLPPILDDLVPRLAAALDGDPGTTTP